MKRRASVGARALVAAAGLVASTALLVACGDAGVLFFDDCEDEMAATRAEFGEPQKIVKGESGLNEWVDFHYWYIGLRRSFDWGTYDNCDVSDTRFEPLPEPQGAAPAGG
jgi:hypothetical protein